MNLFFLVFIFFYLKADFAKRFSVNVDDPNVARILRFSRQSNKKEKISELVFNSNTLISQLKNINYFILITALLYVVLLTKSIISGLYDKGSPVNENTIYLFHFATDLLSYAGAFYLLRCFFVMYLPTVDPNGNDILKARTNIYILVGLFLMVFDIAITLTNKNGIFISEFICGVVNAVVFILLIARFENKILDIPPWILCLLYVYAILQTCLPFVTENFLTKEMLEANKDFKKFLESFSGIVLLLCLVGKVTFSAVLLYVLNSKRIFYYFMTLRKIHAEEEGHWVEFYRLIKDFPISPESFSIIYNTKTNATYIATVPNLFPDVSGEGLTTKEAKDNLLNKIKSVGRNQTTGKSVEIEHNENV